MRLESLADRRRLTQPQRLERVLAAVCHHPDVPEVIALSETVSLPDLTVELYALEVWDEGVRMLGMVAPAPLPPDVGGSLLSAIETDPPFDTHDHKVAVEEGFGCHRVEWTIPTTSPLSQVRIGGTVVFEAS
jgi:hypothetical protein